MRKVYLEGRLGKEFGEEWTLAVNTPAEALQAIAVQRPGLRKFLMESEGIEGYDILVDDEPIENLYQLGLSCLLYTSPSPRDLSTSRMPSSA